MNAPPIHKYPRTPHIEGSRVQPGDENLSARPFSEISGKHIVVEEKMDGANAAISFTKDGRLLLQSRGHYLSGGHREKHFALFKQWGSTHQETLRPVLSDRYILFGEWLYAKHTIFYDQLPHYFMEFDIFDRHDGIFLSTPRRRELLKHLPIVSVRVLHEGTLDTLKELKALLGSSHFMNQDPHIRSHSLQNVANQKNLNWDTILNETDPSTDMEGLYIKVEDQHVCARYKFVRASFLTQVVVSETHWLNRPIIPNQLMTDVNIFDTGCKP